MICPRYVSRPTPLKTASEPQALDMSDDRPANMLEATRLTRAGRLAEATAPLSQGRISTAAAGDPSSGLHLVGVAVTFRALFEPAGRFFRARQDKPAPLPDLASETRRSLARS